MVKKREGRRERGQDNSLLYVALTLATIFILPDLLSGLPLIILPFTGGSTLITAGSTVSIPVNWRTNPGASNVKTSLNPLNVLTGGETVTSIEATATLDYQVQGTVTDSTINDRMQVLFDGSLKKTVSFTLPPSYTPPVTIGTVTVSASEIEQWAGSAYGDHILTLNIPSGGTFTVGFASGGHVTVDVLGSSRSLTVTLFNNGGELPVLNGFSGSPTGYAGIDKIISAINEYGFNAYRISFNPSWTTGTRPYTPTYVDYFLAHCNHYLIIDRNHLYPPTEGSLGTNWAKAEAGIFEVLQRWGNNPRVVIEIINEYNQPDQYTRVQTIIDHIRAAGYTNPILFNKQPSSTTWVKLNDPLNRIYQGCHYYFGEGQSSYSLSQSRTLTALGMGLNIVNTEVGASWNEYSDYTSTNVARLSQWLAWSKTNNVGNMIWLSHDVDNLSTYKTLGLVIP